MAISKTALNKAEGYYKKKKKEGMSDAAIFRFLSNKHDISIRTLKRYKPKWDGDFREVDPVVIKKPIEVANKKSVPLKSQNAVFVKSEEMQKATKNIKLNDEVLEMIVDFIIRGASIPEIVLSFMNKADEEKKRGRSNDKNIYLLVDRDTVGAYLIAAKEWISKTMIVDLRFSSALTLHRLETIYKKSLKSNKLETAMRAVMTQDAFRRQIYAESKKESKDLAKGMTTQEIDDEINRFVAIQQELMKRKNEE